MRKGKRSRRLWRLLVVTVLLLVGATLLLRLRLGPLVEELARTQVMNEASNLVADAIVDQIASGDVAYDRIVHFEKDESGSILALKIDMSEINRLKTEILLRINEEIMDFDRSELSIPIGNLIFPTVFSGRGPMIPVQIISIRNSDAEFESEFSEAGINQTLHQIMLNVSVSMTILSPAGTQELSVTSGMVVAETVLIGQVPQAMLSSDS